MSMDTNTIEDEVNDCSMILHKEELMTSLSNDAIPTFRKARFLKPLSNTSLNQPLPETSLSFSSNPIILHNIKDIFLFKCRKWLKKNWKAWVENLQQTHQSIWNKVGIFDAIRASTYRISLDNVLIMNLAQKWCPETNTFIFPWGECTITLEDVFILGGFSVLGDSVNSVLSTFEGIHSEDKAMEAKLANCCAEIKRKCCGHLPNYGWLKYFQGKGDELEHVALLAMWLCRYVLSTASDIDSNVFGLAIRLAKGTRIALASAVLASIYRELSLLKGKIIALNTENGDDGSNLILWSPLQLVQVWAWERFPTLSPKPVPLVHGEPRIARWHNLHKLKIGSLSLEKDYAEDLFLWRPYGLYLNNWEFPKFYSDQEMWVVINFEVDDDYLSFAKFLQVCELEGVDCVEQYLPNRVGKQFGMDQDIPDSVPRKNEHLNLAWRSYNKTLEGLKCYVPPRLLEGDITVRYLKWWKGASTSCNEALIGCQSQSSQPRKLKILFKSVRPQLYSARQCNEVMQLDSRNHKDIYKGKLAPCENIVTRSKANLVTEIARNLDNGIGDGRTCDHISMEVSERGLCNTTMDDRSHHFQVINTQSSSIMAVEAINGKELPRRSQLISVFIDVSKHHNPDNANTLDNKAHNHNEVAKVSESVREGLGSKSQKILHCSSPPRDFFPGFGFEASGEQLHNEISPSLERLRFESPLNGVNEAEKVNVLTRKSTPLKSMTSPSPENGVDENASLDISIIPENKMGDGRTSENIPMEVNEVDGLHGCNIITEDINKTFESNHPYNAVIVKELLQWSETEESCKENSPSREEQLSENRLKFVNEVGQVTALNPLTYPKVEQGRTSKYEDNAITIDVEEMSDQDDPLEALCKDLDDRISKLEVKFSKLMSA